MKKRFLQPMLLLHDRLFILIFITSILFLWLLLRFYALQVLHYEEYTNNMRRKTERTIEIPATRGMIFDRYGNPLAINESINVLKFDQQILSEKEPLNKILLRVIKVLEKNGDTFIDEVPISLKAPFKLTGGSQQINQLTYNVPCESEIQRQELLTYTAEQWVAYLRKQFKIDKSLSAEEARKLIALRVEIFKSSFSQYKLVDIALKVSDQTMSEIEENREAYPGFSIVPQPFRYYPEGEVVGNILGYTRTITENQWTKMQQQGKNYDREDSIGQMGIEQSMEECLKGEKGFERVAVDNFGRRIYTLSKKQETQGKDIFLSLDLSLQKATYNSLEKRLGEGLIERLKGSLKSTSNGEKPLESKVLIKSLIESNTLDLDKLAKATADSKQRQVGEALQEAYKKMDPLMTQNFSLKQLLLEWLDENKITEKELLWILQEQGLLHFEPSVLSEMQQNWQGTTEELLIDQLQKGYLKPKHFSVDPCSGAAVVVDVQSGEVLSLVGYPSFDNNKLSTDFNAYYSQLIDGLDKRSILVNRATKTVKAPGSTYKMITAIAGLEEGVITPQEKINDTGTFTQAGKPYPRCWVLSTSGNGHGKVDLNRAIEVSCNYYFYEVAYRLAKRMGTGFEGINALNHYANLFGLGQKTGIELDEATPNISSPLNLVKQRVGEVLTNLKNMQGHTKEESLSRIKSKLQKELYVSKEREANKVFEDELKRQLEPYLQQVMEPYYTPLLEECLVQIQKKLGTDFSEVMNQVVNGTMQDVSQLTLEVKVQKALSEALESMLDDPLNQQLKEAIDRIPTNELLDRYEQAYLKAYRKEIREPGGRQEANKLFESKNHLQEQLEGHKVELITKMRQNIINLIVNELFDGVELKWTDGFTVRTAMGQANNAFSPLQIVRYIAKIANRRANYDLTLISATRNYKQAISAYETSSSQSSEHIAISDKTMDLIHKGMLSVTKGSEGTAREVFRTFPITIGAKTGTAEDGKHEHGWFVGFAPYEKPQIAVVVTLYNADSLGSASQLIARDILESYFKIGTQEDKTTLENTFIH